MIIINIKKPSFFNDKEILLVACYDVIMKLSKLSEDYIAITDFPRSI